MIVNSVQAITHLHILTIEIWGYKVVFFLPLFFITIVVRLIGAFAMLTSYSGVNLQLKSFV